MKKLSPTEWIAVTAGVVVVAAVFFFPQLFRFGRVSSVGKTDSQTITASSALEATDQPTDQPKTMTTSDGLSITDTVVGTGAEATPGKTVAIHYTGKFTDGKVFDSSIPRGEPLTFVLGAPGLIEGFSKGTLGMKVGGKRTIVIPPALGYGSQANGPIPANSTLVFDLELVSVK